MSMVSRRREEGGDRTPKRRENGTSFGRGREGGGLLVLWLSGNNIRPERRALLSWMYHVIPTRLFAVSKLSSETRNTRPKLVEAT